MKGIRLLAVIGLCASVSAARAATLEEFNVQGWIVGAYSDNRTGLFTHIFSGQLVFTMVPLSSFAAQKCRSAMGEG